MRAILAAVMLVVALAGPASAKKFRGAPVDLDIQAANVADVFKLIADVGKLSIVLVDVPEIRLDIQAKRMPWDQLLEDVIARGKLAYHRVGSVILVGAPAWIAERKQAKARTYRGTPMDLDVNGADAAAVAMLVRAVAGAKVDARPGAPRKAHLRVRRVPADQAFEVVALQTGATEVAPAAAPPPTAGCVAPALPIATLTLVATARAKTRRAALLVDAQGVAYLVETGACVGKESAKAQIGEVWAELDVAGTRHTLPLYPAKR